MSSSITFTDRELAVARLVFSGYKAVDPTGITAADWEKIARDAGIENGKAGRNAKFAFTSLLGKIKGDKAKAVKRGSEDGEEGEADASPAPKKAKRGTAKRVTKAMGGVVKSEVKVEDDEDGADVDAAEGATE